MPLCVAGWWLVSGFVSDDHSIPIGRATTWDGFLERIAIMFQTEAEAYRRFEPQPSDVIISPFAKCGTTWLQQIAHSLRTKRSLPNSDTTATSNSRTT